MDLVCQTLETITEYCQGPCHENQVGENGLHAGAAHYILCMKNPFCEVYNVSTPPFFVLICLKKATKIQFAVYNLNASSMKIGQFRVL